MYSRAISIKRSRALLPVEGWLALLPRGIQFGQEAFCLGQAVQVNNKSFAELLLFHITVYIGYGYNGMRLGGWVSCSGIAGYGNNSRTVCGFCKGCFHNKGVRPVSLAGISVYARKLQKRRYRSPASAKDNVRGRKTGSRTRTGLSRMCFPPGLLMRKKYDLHTKERVLPEKDPPCKRTLKNRVRVYSS